MLNNSIYESLYTSKKFSSELLLVYNFKRKGLYNDTDYINKRNEIISDLLEKGISENLEMFLEGIHILIEKKIISDEDISKIKTELCNNKKIYPVIIPQESKERIIEKIIVEEKTISDNQIFCFNCGNKIIKGSNFCSYCGTNFKISSPYIAKYNIVEKKDEEENIIFWLLIGFISSIISIFFLPPLFGILGIFCGYIAHKKGSETGGGLIVILSIICMVIGIFWGILAWNARL